MREVEVGRRNGYESCNRMDYNVKLAIALLFAQMFEYYLLPLSALHTQIVVMVVYQFEVDFEREGVHVQIDTGHCLYIFVEVGDAVPDIY